MTDTVPAAATGLPPLPHFGEHKIDDEFSPVSGKTTVDDPDTSLPGLAWLLSVLEHEATEAKNAAERVAGYIARLTGIGSAVRA